MIQKNLSFFISIIFLGEDGQKVRLISIPEFSNTFQVCVLNLKTLECVPISFKT
jgi:hypothetical protein